MVDVGVGSGSKPVVAHSAHPSWEKLARDSPDLHEALACWAETAGYAGILRPLEGELERELAEPDWEDRCLALEHECRRRAEESNLMASAGIRATEGIQARGRSDFAGFLYPLGALNALHGALVEGFRSAADECVRLGGLGTHQVDLV